MTALGTFAILTISLDFQNWKECELFNYLENSALIFVDSKGSGNAPNHWKSITH